VKKIIFAILLLSLACACVESKPKPTDPNPADYTISVHVSASHLVVVSTGFAQVLDVVIVIRHVRVYHLPQRLRVQ
jgi:hypothetical protein